MLFGPIHGQLGEVVVWDIVEQVGSDFPEMLVARGGRVVRRGCRRVTVARGRRGMGARLHLVLQPRQCFGQQGRDRLARLIGECDQQVFLFRRQIKSMRVHRLTIPRAPPLCKASPERDGRDSQRDGQGKEGGQGSGSGDTLTELRGSCTSNLRLIRQPDRPGTIPSLLYLYEGLLPWSPISFSTSWCSSPWCGCVSYSIGCGQATPLPRA